MLKKKAKVPKEPKIKPTKKERVKNNLSLYANLTHKRQTKKDLAARKKAEYLASLPKNPIKRFFVRLSPKHFFGYWFSLRGLKTFLKIMAVLIVLGVGTLATLFIYYSKDLDLIRPEELAKRVQSTVNRYEDRNGVLLWEDKGDGDYKLVVEGSEISTYMRQATVAAEDHSFYSHIGVDLRGQVRAVWSTLTGKEVQGGSTLTMQLIKQVYFSDIAGDRTVSGIPRKIKEIILAIQVERMYDKEQIITLYLNESPYGGRRNGVQSGAQTYFGKSAKDLNLAESALLASIPNNPSVYNPYYIDGNEELIGRQHYVLDSMAELGYISKEEAEEAKAVPILDQMLPEQDQYSDIKAPHFVLEVKKQLEAEFGVKTIRAGGLTIKTTLDYEAQKYAEAATATGAQYLYLSRSDNIALSSVDVATGQVIAMVGSVDWSIPSYGQTNAATSMLEPGSSIKPIADYAPLFKQRTGVNYGPGSILKDENINSIYCSGNTSGSCGLNNFTGRFYGNVTIRNALASSLNIPAVKAMYINGTEDSIKTARALGDISYCTDNANAGLSSAIGGGCGVRPVEHANAYATFARGGTYKPLGYILEVKNSSNEVIKKWEDTAGTQAVDPQVAYMISDILHDPVARASLVWGSSAYQYGFEIPNVWTAVKTGTTDNGSGYSKDLWVASYSPVIATTVWNGNHDGSAMLGNDSMHVAGRQAIAVYMENVHKNVYGPQGKWQEGLAINRPAGIQSMNVNGKTDIWPSWVNKDNIGTSKETMTFDSISKKRATQYTPASTRVEIEVTKTIDPITKKEVLTAPDGYDPEQDDDVHSADDTPPTATVSLSGSGATRTVNINFSAGTFSLDAYTVTIDDVAVKNGNASSFTPFTHTFTSSEQTIKVRITDTGGYESTATFIGPTIP